MRYAVAVLCFVLSACAAPTHRPPELEPETQTAAAVGSPALWRWIGRAVLTLIQNTAISVKLEPAKEEKPGG